MYFKSLLETKLKTSMKFNYQSLIIAFLFLLIIPKSDAMRIVNTQYYCNYTNTIEDEASSACEITITDVTAQNCNGVSPFTAEWLVEFNWSDNPSGDIMIQRNSEPAQAYTPSGNSGTFVITGVPADGGASDVITVYFANENTCTDDYTITRPLPCPASLPHNSGEICNTLLGTTIAGTVFDDGNYDADYQSVSVTGVMGVTISAYNSRGVLIATTYSDANGNYEFTGLTEEHYRIEFYLPDAISEFKKVTQNGTENRTTVQFKRPGECASLGVATPGDFCDGVPWIAVPCYNYGSITNNMGDAFVTYPIDTNASTTPSAENMLSMPNVRHLATHQDIGSTYGVAYSQDRQAIYTSAYMKRHCSFGADGTGVIYSIDPSGQRPTSVLVDLNTLFGANTAGVNPHDYVDGGPCPAGTTGDCWFNDIGTDSMSWFSVGRIAFGDIEISADQSTLYAMNLANRRLYKIPIDNPTAASIQIYSFPLNQNTDPNVTITCGDPANSIRPMGLAWNDGKLYAGATCTDFVANTSAPYEGGSVIYVYEFDPVNETWNIVLNEDIQRASVEKMYKWRDYSQDYYANPNDREHLRGFMILSDIEFQNDTMILGTRDMVGDILGFNTGWPVPGGTIFEKYHGQVGDILRTCPQPDGTWKVENSTTCGGGGINNPANPCPTCGIEGLGSYYYGDYVNFPYVESSLGSLAEWPGSGQIFLTTFDPLDISLTQGMVILGHQTGALNQAYNLGPTDFGKTAGLGDIEMICAPAPLMIGNRIWLDENGDGIQSAGEPGIGGIVVSLFAADGSKIAEVKSDVNGNYYFRDADLTAYNSGKLFLFNPNTQYYVVVGSGQFNTTDQTLMDIYTLTDANTGEGSEPTLNDSDGTIATGVSVAFNDYPYASVTTGVDGTTENSVDFGFTRTRNIGDLVWIDEDANGLQNKGELGIPNVKMTLSNQGGTVIATTYTDINGNYLFREIPHGIYTVDLDASTLPVGLDNPTYDQDGFLDDSYTLTSNANFEFLDVDFGYNWVSVSNTDNPFTTSMGAIGSLIWHDVNGDGIWDSNEPGIENVTVSLYQDLVLDGAYDEFVGSVQTNEFGRYIFENLPTAAYVVVVDDSTLPTGYTTQPTGDPDSDANNRSLPFVLAPGDVLLNYDFGYQNPTSYTLSGSTFMDLNVGGTKDGDEPLIENVTVKLLNASGNVIATTVTDANGDYSFPGLANGTYTILINDINTILDGLTNNVDPDGGTTNESVAIINNANLTDRDFGYITPDHASGDASIGDFVYMDLNANGSYQPTEPGIENVLVILMDDQNDVLATTQTNENGNYFFGGLAAGDYKVALHPASFNSWLRASADPDGSAPADFESGLVTLAAGASNVIQDFGLKANIASTINGTVWEDADAEGDLDEVATGIENVTILLTDTLQNRIAQTITDAAGDFSFTGLPNGIYEVNVTDNSNQLLGYWHSLGSSPSTNNNSQVESYRVEVIGGAINETADFGYYLKGASLGNFVWSDRNNNGLQDPAEKGVEQAEVTLKIDYDGNGTPEVVLVTVTDINGAYRFDNLLLDEDYNTGLPTGPAFSMEVTVPGDFNSTIIDANGNANDMEDSEDPNSAVVEPKQGSTTVALLSDPLSEAVPASYDFGLYFDCNTPMVDYAMSLDASNNSGQTTDYFYMDSIEMDNAGLSPMDAMPATDGGHVPMTQEHGRIRAYDYCENAGWRYYFNPLDPDEYLFAIEMGTNVTEIDYIEIRVDDMVTDRHEIDANFATFVMERDWLIETVDDTPFEDAGGSPATINVRFYFPPNEFKEMLNAAIAQAAIWSSATPTTSNVKWFYKPVFDPDMDISPDGSNLLPFNIKNLRNAATGNNGNNTALTTPTVENSKNHIQFNGISETSGGTAMIKIDRVSLPVELLRFEAEADGCDVLLNWLSASETEFSHYELERSSDGNQFDFVTRVDAATDQEMNYQHFDDEAAPRNYYRLKMVDLDGSYEYSNIVIVVTECESINSDWMIYPNPLSTDVGLLNVKFFTNLPSVRLSIFNDLRQELKVLELDVSKGWNTLQWDMSDLPAGKYYIRNSRAEGGKSYKFIVIQK